MGTVTSILESPLAKILKIKTLLKLTAKED
jgi:hypothetical protein